MTVLFVRNSRVYYSASDLKGAVECEWALMRKLDSKLGRIEAVEDATDAMLERASKLGGEHEARALANYKTQFPGTVVEIETEDARADPEILRNAQTRTIEALRSGADVVFQATFLDEPEDATIGFVGFADFLVKSDDGYQVWDTKLARKARVTALLQLAAYADQLRRLGIPVSDDTYLLLGSGEESRSTPSKTSSRCSTTGSRGSSRCSRHASTTRTRSSGAPPDTPPTDAASGAPPKWNAPATYCSSPACAPAPGADWRMSASTPSTTWRAARDRVEGVGEKALEKLRAQARMQLLAPPPAADGTHEVLYEVASAAGLSALPPSDPGDIFFDFEGDPLWTSNGLDWGLDYLWGLVTLEQPGVGFDTRPPEPGATQPAETFTAFWAHDRGEEKQALVDFLAFVQERRKRYPGLHIYHYADYERAHLLQLTARYGVGEAILDELLTEDVFVDLYPIVRRSIRISEGSYSIKKLEPLYMGDEVRVGDLVKGDESIQFYVDYTELRDAGAGSEADAKLEEIRAYNEYDCVSTHRLRDWLLARALENGIEPVSTRVAREVEAKEIERQEAVVRDALYAHVDGIPAEDRTDDQQAIALAAAAIEYHRREDKTYWWGHFARQAMDESELADDREVFFVESSSVTTDWAKPTPRSAEHRVLRLRGTIAGGARVREGDQPYAMYDQPVPEVCGDTAPGLRGEHAKTRILSVTPLDGRPDAYDIELDEAVGRDGSPWTQVPIALTPGRPIPTAAQRQAILTWGGQVAEKLPAFDADPALDILRRIPPRMIDDLGLDEVGIDGTAAAIAGSLQRLDNSYLAVQGPPGSGKTYVGSNVIAHLVTELGWKVGVVAQSHDVIENLLRKVLSAGVPAAQIGKKASSAGYAQPPGWTVLEANEDVPVFITEHFTDGFVLGGTAWDFANAGKVQRDSLDLLVIDEAGQYSLADTIAVSVSAKRLLLLGDPQQLPQVTTGAHPEDIHLSALGWLSGGLDVLPAELGYFLEETWRMHPALTRAVSDLSYQGRLRSHLPDTTDRSLLGAEPGLHPVPVAHEGNSIESAEECAAVVTLVKHHIGMPWRDPSDTRNSATGRDDNIRPTDLIVVAPYNAQVDLLRRTLAAEGLGEVPVGTVDKFQGQEAAIAIVSLTASSALDVPRGVSFLLQRNRLNVAISRGKWAAYLVHSPALRDFLPVHPQGLAELSGFIRLTTQPSTST